MPGQQFFQQLSIDNISQINHRETSTKKSHLLFSAYDNTIDGLSKDMTQQESLGEGYKDLRDRIHFENKRNYQLRQQFKRIKEQVKQKCLGRHFNQLNQLSQENQNLRNDLKEYHKKKKGPNLFENTPGQTPRGSHGTRKGSQFLLKGNYKEQKTLRVNTVANVGNFGDQNLCLPASKRLGLDMARQSHKPTLNCYESTTNLQSYQQSKKPSPARRHKQRDSQLTQRKDYQSSLHQQQDFLMLMNENNGNISCCEIENSASRLKHQEKPSKSGALHIRKKLQWNRPINLQSKFAQAQQKMKKNPASSYDFGQSSGAKSHKAAFFDDRSRHGADGFHYYQQQQNLLHEDQSSNKPINNYMSRSINIQQSTQKPSTSTTKGIFLQFLQQLLLEQKVNDYEYIDDFKEQMYLQQSSLKDTASNIIIGSAFGESKKINKSYQFVNELQNKIKITNKKLENLTIVAKNFQEQIQHILGSDVKQVVQLIDQLRQIKGKYLEMQQKVNNLSCLKREVQKKQEIKNQIIHKKKKQNPSQSPQHDQQPFKIPQSLKLLFQVIGIGQDSNASNVQIKNCVDYIKQIGNKKQTLILASKKLNGNNTANNNKVRQLIDTIRQGRSKFNEIITIYQGRIEKLNEKIYRYKKQNNQGQSQGHSHSKGQCQVQAQVQGQNKNNIIYHHQQQQQQDLSKHITKK